MGIEPSLLVGLVFFARVFVRSAERGDVHYKLYAMLHSQLKTANCAHKKVGMARYPKWHCLVDSFRDQRFSLETWIVYLFGIKINGFKPSSEALGRLL